LCSRGSTKQNDSSKIFFSLKRIFFQTSGDGTLSEYEFEEFLEIFVHFQKKKVGEKKKQEKKHHREVKL